MELSIAEAARRLGVGENALWDLIRSRRLAVDTATGVPRIAEASLAGLIEAGVQQTEPEDAPATEPDSRADVLQSIVQRLGALENQVKVKWDLLKENRHLSAELREREKEIAGKELEIDRLNRDMVYQKRLLDKELEDQQKFLAEKWALMEGQMLQQLAQERAQLERLLALEQERWQERFDREKELCSQRLEEERKREGFWSRLIKMMTWS
jgi:predicted RNase H-like nuclease (RuvC/YqgF family)